jgi:hypothetical protein
MRGGPRGLTLREDVPEALLGHSEVADLGGIDRRTGYFIAAGVVVAAGGLFTVLRQRAIWQAVTGAVTDAGAYLEEVSEDVKQAMFKTIIPVEARPYADVILRVSREEGVSPLITVGIGQRESRWGAALSPPGPLGTGDYGHGRGLMQIDDRAHPAFIAKGTWQIPEENIRYGLKVLKSALTVLGKRSRFVANGVVVADGAGRVYLPASLGSLKPAQARGVSPGDYPDPRPLTGAALLAAGLAAYNTGALNVLWSLACGRPADHTTAGSKESAGRGDYSQWVLSRVASLEASLASAVA